jgi:carbon-monoxide dehydrogenase large subunit
VDTRDPTVTTPQLEIPRGKWIGARVRRVEDPRYLTGQAQYVADIALPRLTHAAFVRSDQAHAAITEIDTRQAKQMPGVIGVFTAKDLPQAHLIDSQPLEGLHKTPQPVLASDRVRFVGEAVAVVVADDRARAEDAADSVRVEYDVLEAVTDTLKAMEKDAPRLFENLDSNIVYHTSAAIGDAEGILREADHIFRATYHTNRYMAAPMETRGCIADYHRASKRLTVWSSTQTPHALRGVLAQLLEIPEQMLRVITPEVGGGFGQKISTYPEEVVIPLVALQLGRPTKWIEDRRENLLAATQAKEQVIELEAAVSASGELLALRARCIGDGGAYSFNPASLLVEPMVAATLMPGVYKLKDYAYEVVGVLTNKAPTGTYRGVGWTAGQTARELLFDEICRELHLDPLEFRERNMVAENEFPYRACTGAVYDSGSFRESLKRVAELIDYDRLLESQEQTRAEGRYVGVGLSPYVEPTAFGSEIGFQCGFPVSSYDTARVSIDPSGKVTVAASTSSHGQGHETTLAQVAADVLGVDMEDVIVLHGDTDATPFGMGTYASRSAVIGGGSVALAAQEVRRKLLAIAARMLEVSEGDLILESGSVSVRGAPFRAKSVSEIAHAAYFARDIRSADLELVLAETAFYDPRATYSNGCIGAVVEVDIDTGVVDVRRIAAVEDCGTLLNPLIVEGQIEGAIAQGIGGALYEELLYDENGQPKATTYMDYLVPTASQVPEIIIEHLVSPSPFTVAGIKGMGESGMIACPSAILNAVANALARFNPRIRAMPLTPERVLALTREADGD